MTKLAALARLALSGSIGHRLALGSCLRRLVFASLLVTPVVAHAESITADDRCGGVEYRLEAGSNEPGSKDFVWWNGRPPRRLADHAFLDASGIRAAELRPSRPLPGRWNIEIFHSRRGAKKFAAFGDANRDRQFSIVVGAKILQSYAFPPSREDIYQGGTSAGAFPKAEAERLLREIEEAIEVCSGK